MPFLTPRNYRQPSERTTPMFEFCVYECLPRHFVAEMLFPTSSLRYVPTLSMYTLVVRALSGHKITTALGSSDQPTVVDAKFSVLQDEDGLVRLLAN